MFKQNLQYSLLIVIDEADERLQIDGIGKARQCARENITEQSLLLPECLEHRDVVFRQRQAGFFFERPDVGAPLARCREEEIAAIGGPCSAAFA